MRKSRLKIGEILINAGLLSEEQLKEALEIQRAEGGRIGELLVKLGFVDEKNIVEALGKQLGIPYTFLSKGLLKPTAGQDLEKIVSEDFARQYLILPLSKNLNSLTVAMADPLDIITIDNLRRMTSCEVNPILTTKSDILRAISEFYGERSMLEEAIKQSYELDTANLTSSSDDVDEEKLSLDELIAKAEEAPVVKLVDLILKQAIEDRASDIHIEPMLNKINIRYRIDGILYEIPPPAHHLLPPLISRIKILSRLDIAEKRLPQDGGFVVKEEDRLIDLRVSTIPTIYGEKVVIRVLDKTAVPLVLSNLGFEPQALKTFDDAIRQPYGLILLTGPTGSGKTTTLYAALNTIKSPHKNINTIEDPVEYKLDGINQVQARSTIGLTFASGLRSFLRQDPDVLMVGEIRDLETAEICIKAALTGHMVFSTLHTNDAAGAISRLIDLGIEPFLVTSSLALIAAQRLVRRLCDSCKEAYEPTPEILQSMKVIKMTPELLYKAKGCKECTNTGFRGRVAIYEVLYVDPELKAMITKGATDPEVKKRAVEKGMMTLRQCALLKAAQGVTSVEEAMGVTIADDEG